MGSPTLTVLTICRTRSALGTAAAGTSAGGSCGTMAGTSASTSSGASAETVLPDVILSE